MPERIQATPQSRPRDFDRRPFACHGSTKDDDPHGGNRMFKRSLVCAALVEMIGIATSAFAATPVVPNPTTAGSPANPAVERVQWRGGGWNNRGGWQRGRYRWNAPPMA